MHARKGHVFVDAIALNSPATGLVEAQEVLVAVNGIPVEGDAHMAQRAIALALGQSKPTGHCAPVRLTLAKLVKATGAEDLDSPKGVEAALNVWMRPVVSTSTEYGVVQSL